MQAYTKTRNGAPTYSSLARADSPDLTIVTNATNGKYILVVQPTASKDNLLAGSTASQSSEYTAEGLYAFA